MPVRPREKRMTTTTIERLARALAETLRALEAHLDRDADHYNVMPAELCPCYNNEVKRAREALAAYRGET